MGYKAYDAHVGETACHIRAGMLLELYSAYQKGSRIPENSERKELKLLEYVKCLEQTKKNAQDICLQLTSHNTCPSKLGLGSKLEDTHKFIAALGWIEPEICLDSGPLKWDVDNQPLIVRYLIALFVLAKYRKASKCSTTNHTVVRLQPDKAASYASDLIAPSWDQKNSLYQESGCNRLDARFKSLQKWVSVLSCSWVQVWAAKLSFSEAAQTLVTQSIKDSPKGLQAMAAYTGFLACRRVWAENEWPLLLVDRHFCSQGYHLNFFEARLRPSRPPPAWEHHIISKLSWEVTPLQSDDLLISHMPQEPMLCILGNSIGGPHEEYLARILDASPEGSIGSTSQHHTNGRCASNVEHRHRFLQMDHDRLSQAFFAAHRAYPFPLTNGSPEGGDGEDMLTSIGRSLPNDPIERYFLKSKAEVNDVGAGKENMGTFRWEHVFAETPGRLVHVLQGPFIARRFL